MMFEAVTWVYPQGKKRAVTFSYDDGQIFDRRVVKTLNEHGMKGTFNLCSSFNMGEKNKASYIPAEEIQSLYQGHEVAVHGAHHPYLERVAPGQVLAEILEDRRTLERLAGQVVTGMAYPYGSWNDMVLAQLKAAGIQYSRTTRATMHFDCPREWLTWDPTCHHNDALPLVEPFCRQGRSLSLFYIWGHSYEFDRNKNWDVLERLCDALPKDGQTWYATNGEIFRYIHAIQQMVFSVDQNLLHNPTAQEVWFLWRNECPRSVPPGTTIELK